MHQFLVFSYKFQKYSSTPCCKIYEHTSMSTQMPKLSASIHPLDKNNNWINPPRVIITRFNTARVTYQRFAFMLNEFTYSLRVYIFLRGGLTFFASSISCLISSNCFLLRSSRAWMSISSSASTLLISGSYPWAERTSAVCGRSNGEKLANSGLPPLSSVFFRSLPAVFDSILSVLSSSLITLSSSCPIRI